MTELRTAALTVLGGVLVYVLGHMLEKFVLEPVLEQRRLIGQIASSLVFYANEYSNPGKGRPEAMAEARDAFRDQASELRASAYTVPCYGIFAWLRRVPALRAVIQASHDLIGLSNSIHTATVVTGPETSLRIRQLLGIPSGD